MGGYATVNHTYTYERLDQPTEMSVESLIAMPQYFASLAVLLDVLWEDP